MHRYTMIVGEQSHGKSLLTVMRRAWPLLPELAFREALRNKDVQVNGQRVKTNVILKAGDELVLYTRQGMREIPVVYEDAQYILVNKPAGVNTDRNAASDFSLLSWAEARAEGHYQPQLCHRLDNQTSGLCLIAKDEPSAEAARAAFKTREVIKKYQCLALGTPDPDEAVLKAYLSKDARMARVTVSEKPNKNSKQIITAYKVLEAGEISRLEVHLVTGRTHQIRAHLAYIGHPILGDDVYGDRSANRRLKQSALRLCAVSLAFPPDCGVESLKGRCFSVLPPF